MAHNCALALVGTGGFAHNVCHVLERGGCQVEYFVDEIKSGTYMGQQVLRAADLGPREIARVSKFVIAISHPGYNAAARDRLLASGVPAADIISLTDDQIIPILTLIFGEFGAAARFFFTSAACRSVFDLECHFFGTQWEQVAAAMDPDKQTLAFCFYGRGGGFRRHIRGLIPHLQERFNLLVLMDEKLPDEYFPVPAIYMGPDTACQPQHTGLPPIDLWLTPHFIPCSPPDRPKVTFLHTSFDFILDPDWIVDRFETADPHYVFTSTRATFDWMTALVARRPLSNQICLIPGGYNRLDENLDHAAAYAGPVDALIYAPTLSLGGLQHHELTYSMPYGAAILQGLLEGFPDHDIVFRPHPNDLQQVRDGRNDELAQPFLAALKLCAEHRRCQLDGEKTFYMDSYNRAAVMVSDTSSTAYTFALSTARPVVFFSPHDDRVREIYAADSAFIRDRQRVGQVVDSVAGMVASIADMIGSRGPWRDRVCAYRDEVGFNLGGAHEYFVANLDYVLAGERHPDWTYFEGRWIS